jgi:hypothetical protein
MLPVNQHYYEIIREVGSFKIRWQTFKCSTFCSASTVQFILIDGGVCNFIYDGSSSKISEELHK